MQLWLCSLCPKARRTKPIRSPKSPRFDMALRLLYAIGRWKSQTSWQISETLLVHWKDINKFGKVPSLTTRLYKNHVWICMAGGIASIKGKWWYDITFREDIAIWEGPIELASWLPLYNFWIMSVPKKCAGVLAVAQLWCYDQHVIFVTFGPRLCFGNA